MSELQGASGPESSDDSTQSNRIDNPAVHAADTHAGTPDPGYAIPVPLPPAQRHHRDDSPILDGVPDDADAADAAPDLSAFTQEEMREARVEHHHHGERRRMSPEHIARLKRRRRRRRILIGVLVVLLLIAAYVAFMGYSAFKVKKAVTQVMQGASAAPAAIQSGDVAAAKSAVSTLTAGVDGAWHETKSPAWGVLEYLPYFGDDVKAARGAIDVLHTVSTEALPKLTAAMDSLNPKSITVKDSTVSMPGLAASAEGLTHADSVLQDALVDLRNLPTPHITQLRTALDKATGGFNTLSGLVDVFARISKTAPTMLDLNGTSARTYLIIAQNNAEVRPTGGLPGSWGTLSVSHGKLTLSNFVPETDLPLLSSPVISETSDERGLFGLDLVTKPHDVNFTPDYPRAAQIAQAMWQKAKGQKVDGVIMIDPVLLQDLLKVTGGITLPGGIVMNGDNAVRYLLHDSYAVGLTPAQQDAAFSLVAAESFQHILKSAGANSTQLVKAVMDSTNNGHLKVWSSHPNEQQYISGSAIAGELEVKPAEPNVGVYFSDGTQGKMDWYLERKVTAAKSRDLADGSSQYKVHVTMANTVDPAEAASLPDYVTGKGMSERSEDVQTGEIVTMVYVYAPADGRLVDWKFSDGGKFDTVTTHNGLTVGAKQVRLKPGESADFTVTVQTSAKAAGTQLQIRQTPLIRDEQ
ncbi:DUF4012 domain-containing protein [Bifidobacterium leontopitheci]|uniref:DUF4012 domain-containing protein n=1 Tax=Bifidobacterium leontopitheci TaxID=2650774 RepID=A0A6I1GIZ0_9BIFI|nr:DUF4012 domain-containing protein [Bifidobacterium leontopitheci]KAB7789596.1 hypothetical protein F7D09_1892 [Bifidobacterium leontopitheci]